MNRTIIALAAVALVAGLAVQEADAACNNAKRFVAGSKDGRFLYNYIGTAGNGTLTPSDGVNHAGFYWEPGTGNDSTGCNVNDWFRKFSYWYLDGNLTTCGTGCPGGEAGDQQDPGGTLNILVEDHDAANAYWFLGSVDDYDSCASQFDLSPVSNECATRSEDWGGGGFALAVQGRPRVTASSRSATDVIVDVSFDDAAGGFYSGSGKDPFGTIQNFVLYSATGTADPGRDASAWTEIGNTAAGPGGGSIAGVTLDCSDTGVDVFLAAGLDFGGVRTAYVSQSTTVECDPNLADPKFKLVDRPDKPGKVRRER